MVNLVAASLNELCYRTDFPCLIKVEADIRIPLADGNWLHARAWLPVDARAKPVPAIIEYAPFRHRDFTAPRDALIHPWFAGHGYASLRVELRGSGDSSGMPNDEYVQQEQDDALEALQWIAAQDWCDGNTGMFGMSWGAFSALQVAARTPPSLKAIIPVHGTDDRFADDIHYKGGCLLGAGLSWGVLQTLYMMRPPDPALFGHGWREQWLTRFDNCPMLLEQWMAHQQRDDYWRHGSVNTDYAQVDCPALVVCGWADGYTNAALRMAQHLPEHSRIWIGPWAHTYPHIAQPGPQAGFLQAALAWWNRWLKQQDNGADREPRLKLWLQESVAPATSYAERNGEWLGFASWPSVAISQRQFYLQVGKLDAADTDVSILELQSPLANAINGPEWLPHGIGPELPPDQCSEDAGSLLFDGTVLASELIVCGAPTLTLYICTDTESGLLQVRLVDLLPDGSATQISYGLLNLLHRDGEDNPKPLVSGEWMEVKIQLNDIAQRVPAGHRLRISVSTQAWPLVWPAAQNMTLQLKTGASFLSLPLLDPLQLESLRLDSAEVAEIPQPLDLDWLRPVERRRKIEVNAQNNRVSRSYTKDDGAFRIVEHGMEVDSWGQLNYHCCGEDPLTAQADYHYRIRQGRGDWRVGVDCEVSVSADRDNFHISGEYRASEAGEVVKRRAVAVSIPRKYV